MLRNFIASIALAYSVLLYIERKSYSLSIFLQHFGRIFGRIFHDNYNAINKMLHFLAGKSCIPIFFFATLLALLLDEESLSSPEVRFNTITIAFLSSCDLSLISPKQLNNAVVNPQLPTNYSAKLYKYFQCFLVDFQCIYPYHNTLVKVQIHPLDIYF